ncbi:MAG TPA: hypothetical protein DCE41_21275 [Cytophagales bacterium]|nr:hypothetical protein [Cytophagales bacterium]HAA21475.1 hypothetical protein [Cytophagales bacterium]HAP65219.1 hypothetical protein [Cytophagales bacterium]
MQEPDLRALWAQGDAEAQTYYERVAPHIEEWAKQRSHDLMAKLKRTALYEMIASVLMIAAFVLYIRPDSPAFIPMVVVFSAIMLFAVVWYWQILKKLRGLQGKSTVESVKRRTEILRRSIRNLQIYMVTITPFALAFGMWMYTVDAEVPAGEESAPWWIYVLVGIPMSVLYIFMIDRLYIRKVYTPILRGYEEVYAKLTQPEEPEIAEG